MRAFQPLPDLWLISDQRNDAHLGAALQRMPRASGFIYRHYHLDDPERRQRYCELRRIARQYDHTIILAGNAITAREWGADGIYGAPRTLTPQRGDLITLAAIHNMRELALASLMRADAALLSPVFPTRSHPGGRALGPARFLLLARRARRAKLPIIALGGMDRARARTLTWPRWAAIDGLS